MADGHNRALGRSGGIDPAALAAASLAVAISAIAPPGPYTPTSMMIGATILVLIFAYDEDPHRSGWEHVAFGAVCALVSLLVIGYPLEYICATDKARRLGAFLHEIEDDLKYSEIPPWLVLVLWLGMTGMYILIDKRWLSKRAPENDTSAQASSTSAASDTPRS